MTSMVQETSLGALPLQFPPQPQAPSTLQAEVGARATIAAELRSWESLHSDARGAIR